MTKCVLSLDGLYVSECFFCGKYGGHTAEDEEPCSGVLLDDQQERDYVALNAMRDWWAIRCLVVRSERQGREPELRRVWDNPIDARYDEVGDDEG